MNKSILFAIATLLTSGTVGAYADNDYDDDIYFNPNKAQKEANKKAKSNYIKNYQEIDVDEYNRRGQYYLTPVDTIGETTASGEDFVYTQQIQKYINPTIVVDNADVLADVLNNSYGNVEIVIDNGTPYFAPCTTLTGPAFYYTSTWAPAWAWGWPSWNWGWGWGPSWAYDPFWGVSWGWSPGWGFSWGAWGPAWGWGPGWGPSFGWGHSPGYYAHHYRPGANRRPTGPGGGLNWAANSRPGGGDRVYAGNGRPGSGLSSRPGSNRVTSSSTGSNYTYSSSGHRIAPGVSIDRNTATGTINSGRHTGVVSQPAGSVDRGLTINGYSSRSNRSVGTSSATRNTYNNSSRGTTTGRGTSSYSTGTTNSRSTNSYNSGSSSRSYNSGSTSRSYNSGSSRSSGGSFGGSRSGGGSSRGGGGGGGRHR